MLRSAEQDQQHYRIERELASRLREPRPQAPVHLALVTPSRINVGSPGCLPCSRGLLPDIRISAGRRIRMAFCPVKLCT